MIAHYLTLASAWFASLALGDQLALFVFVVVGGPIAYVLRPKGGR